MGTLMDQSPRKYCTVDKNNIANFINMCCNIAEKEGVDIDVVLESAKILEMGRRNDLYVKNGDAFDEQMAGFGEILKELVGTLDSINSALCNLGTGNAVTKMGAIEALSVSIKKGLEGVSSAIQNGI